MCRVGGLSAGLVSRLIERANFILFSEETICCMWRAYLLVVSLTQVGHAVFLGAEACPGDWLPPDCTANMNLNTTYLPPRLPRTSGNSSGHHRAAGLLFQKKIREKRLLLQAIQRQQFPLPPGGCIELSPVELDPTPYYTASGSTPMSAIWNFLPAYRSSPRCSSQPKALAEWCESNSSRPIKIVDYGYGSEVHYVMRAINEGLRDRHSVYPVGKLNLAESEDHCLNNHLCYYEPWAWVGCSNSSSKNMDASALASTDQAELAPWVVPATYPTLGMFEYRSITVAFIHRPNSAMRERVRAVAKKIGFDFQQPCIGVHIRRGDSCNDKENHRECFGNEKYIAAVQTMRDKYSIHCAYISTDDASAPIAIRAAFAERDAVPPSPLPEGWKPMRVMDQPADRSAYNKCPNGLCEGKGGKKVFMENERHLYRGAQGYQLGSDMLVDVELLASCAAFVGAMSSNNFRLAIELSYARHGTHAPFISLDTSWCWFGFGEFHVSGRKARIYC